MKKNTEYSAWLRQMAKDFVAGETVNPCPSSLNVVADKLDIQAGKLVADSVLKKHFQTKIEKLTKELHSTQQAMDAYMDAYFNMRDFAIEGGLDVTTYHGPDVTATTEQE